jgi:hypothetical protein
MLTPERSLVPTSVRYTREDCCGVQPHRPFETLFLPSWWNIINASTIRLGSCRRLKTFIFVLAEAFNALTV